MTGCVCIDTGEVFVKLGDSVRPAAILLGKKVKPAAEPICRSATS